MKNIGLKGYLLLLLLFHGSTATYALEVETHKALNEHIATKVITPSGFSLGTYLKNQLGFQSGVDEKFNSLKVWEIMRDGGKYEDKPPKWYTINYLRSVNHFHNPLVTDINQAGFTGVWGTGVLSGTSAILWSQKAKGTQWPYGYYSWYDVRDYFYKAFKNRDRYHLFNIRF